MPISQKSSRISIKCLFTTLELKLRLITKTNGVLTVTPSGYRTVPILSGCLDTLFKTAKKCRREIAILLWVLHKSFGQFSGSLLLYLSQLEFYSTVAYTLNLALWTANSVASYDKFLAAFLICKYFWIDKNK